MINIHHSIKWIVKAILLEEQQWYYLTHSFARGGGGLREFIGYKSKSECNISLEFELTQFEAVVQHFSHYVTGTPPPPWS